MGNGIATQVPTIRWADVKDVLVKHGWVTAEMAEYDDNGELFGYCVLGALSVTHVGHPYEFEMAVQEGTRLVPDAGLGDILDALTALARAMGLGDWATVHAIADWNDEHTQEDVFHVLDMLIAEQAGEK